MILTADNTVRPDPLQNILAGGLGVLGQAIQNSISLGKGRADLQNSQGAQFFDLLQQEQDTRNRRFEFAVGQANTDRAFGRGVLESDRSFSRGVVTSDRSFTLDKDRFRYGVERDIIGDSFRERDLTLRTKAVEANLDLARKSDDREAAAADVNLTAKTLDIAARSLDFTEEAQRQQQQADLLAKSGSLFQPGAGGTEVPRKDVTPTDLQNFIVSNTATQDPQMVARVNTAKLALDRQIKDTTLEQATPVVESLAAEVANLKKALSNPEGQTRERVRANSQQLETQQTLLNKYIERFPELGKITSQLQTRGAVGETPAEIAARLRARKEESDKKK